MVGVLFTGCNDDDDDDNGGGSTPPPTAQEYVTFEIDGAVQGSRSGISIATNDLISEGSLFTFEHMKPVTEPGALWKLTILYSGEDTLQITPGTYTIGDLEAFTDGLTNFRAAYIDESDDGEIVSWTALGVVGGAVVVEEVDAEFISGTFEVEFSNENFGDISITDGEFRSRYFENHH